MFVSFGGRTLCEKERVGIEETRTNCKFYIFYDDSSSDASRKEKRIGEAERNRKSYIC